MGGLSHGSGASSDLSSSRTAWQITSTLWPKARRPQVSFAGRLHEARRTVIEEWMSLQFPDLDIPVSNQSVVAHLFDVYADALQKHSRKSYTCR